jgi:hypothetical protein
MEIAVSREPTAIEATLAERVQQLEDEKRELVEALAHLVERIDLIGGIGEYKGGQPFVLKAARALLAKHTPPSQPTEKA